MRQIPRCLLSGGAVLLTCFLAALYLAAPVPNLERGRDVSALVLARDGSVLRGFLTADDKWRLPTKPDEIDPLYRRMLIAAEDRRFALHPGVDPLAALRAIGQLAWHWHVVSGASTLTMQTVRLLTPRSRTLSSKLVEMAEALGLEQRFGKDKILGLYLTLAPFGGNLEGVRVASLAYFGKEPARLSPGEAALLVALPRSPERLRPDRHPEAARAARDRVLARMRARGVISEAAFTEALAEPVPRERLALPFHAPHLARYMRAADREAAVQRTTIDPALQRNLEALLHREAAALDRDATLAALVVDNRAREIVAYVGNADFSAASRHGTIDMVRAVRSPGSALKPFIYAMAFDRLIVHPETLLDDRRRHFGDYAPDDFDGVFRGEVSAAEALRHSLNVPAVAVLDRLGPRQFAAALAAAGIGLHLPPWADAEPGLALALGGAGISLLDLARLYVALANRGEVSDLRVTTGQPIEAPTAIFGPAAAWYVNDILAAAPPPPGMVPQQARRARPLAFKTGTSYGFRDAWAVGYDSRVTIAVWTGRPDGTPRPGQTGRITAAPVLFKIADLLAAAPPEPQEEPPAGVLRVARRDLPPALRRLDPAAPAPGHRGDAEAPTILYPPDGAVVAWDGTALPLEASGGSRPLRWLVDGRPLPPPAPRRPLFWKPESIGFARLTVIDARGRGTSATIRLAR